MAREFAGNFYKRQEWKNCRAAYISSVGGLCERCLSNGLYNPAKIVHHKIYLNEDNIKEPSITLNWDNLEALCQDCHNNEHLKSQAKRRYIIDADGIVVPIE